MTLEVAVVIPAYNGGRFLGRVLTALRESDSGVRVVVVDAGSTDDTADVASEHGAEVIRLEQREGPARARNVGANETAADVILFLDADCAPHADVVERVRAAFESEPDLVSLSGSYDSQPPFPGFFSQYMNLRHHFFHQRARREQATFWAGCGAVRRKAFVEVGGFDAARYPHPQIEDIELGMRLRRAGRMLLDPDLQVTHLKEWTLSRVMADDILHRAIPWSRLILETGELRSDLNLDLSQRWAAALAPFALAALIVIPWSAWTGRPALLVAGVAILGASLALNARMLRYFAGLRGPGFALRAHGFHQIHLIYSAATFAVCVAEHWTRILRNRIRRR